MFLEYESLDHGQIQLPCLQTLIVITTTYRNGDLKYMTKWDMPNLRRFWVTCIYRFEDKDLLFFWQHGKRLTFLKFRYSSGTIMPILDLCPLLEQITINIDTTFDIWIEHQKVKKFIIKGCYNTPTNMTVLTERLRKFMPTLVDRQQTPLLKLIQLRGFYRHDFVLERYKNRVYSQWVIWLLMLDERNMVLVDGNRMRV